MGPSQKNGHGPESNADDRNDIVLPLLARTHHRGIDEGNQQDVYVGEATDHLVAQTDITQHFNRSGPGVVGQGLGDQGGAGTRGPSILGRNHLEDVQYLVADQKLGRFTEVHAAHCNLGSALDAAGARRNAQNVWGQCIPRNRRREGKLVLGNQRAARLRQQARQDLDEVLGVAFEILSWVQHQLDIAPRRQARAISELEAKAIGDVLADIRMPFPDFDRVADVRAQIDAGSYETDEKIDIAVGRLLDEIG